MQLMPAGAAFEQAGFSSLASAQTYSNSGSQGYFSQASSISHSQQGLLRQDSAQSVSSSSAPQHLQPRASPRPVRPPPRAPATPAEAKAAELVASQLGAFNLHAETVSALKPSPRLAMQQAQQPMPLAAMRTPR
jgi:hypothetical protein